MSETTIPKAATAARRFCATPAEAPRAVSETTIPKAATAARRLLRRPRGGAARLERNNQAKAACHRVLLVLSKEAVMARETDILNDLRKAYTAEGYQVTIRPRLPVEDGPDLVPDLLAVKGEEHVLVGIRTMNAGSPEGGAGAAGAARLAALAEVAQDNDGWTFRMVLADGPGDRPAPLPMAEDIRPRIADARRLARKGDLIPAMLYGWALLTGIAARRLEAAGIAHAERHEPSSLCKTMVAQGLAAQEDLPWLERAADVVVLLGRGHVTLSVDMDLFDRVCAHCLALCQNRTDGRASATVRM